jgi:eukaryotic-like serine/threonine-protein kinase
VSEPAKLATGTVFAGDFKVIRPLRTGGQGSLYVVEQLSTSKHRALKLMLPELVAQPASRKRFELEAKIAARIHSDHVVESIASGVDDTGTPWLVMELLEGQDLAAYTQERRRLPPGEVLEIFSQLCHALGEAHRQGIVHRDLKPENIFLANARRRGVPFMVKVLDFGIARILAEAQTISSATTTGLGTPMWMAPEQATPGGPIAPSTDVWPLGLLAFRLLTGYLFWKAPYDPGASVMMLMAEAFMHPVPTASERAAHYKCRDRIPLGFDAWFAKCVSRSMDQRFAGAAEAFAALEPILAKIGEEASIPQRPSVIGIVAPSPSSRRPADLPLVLVPPEEGAASTPAPGSIPEPRISTAAGVGPLPTGPGLKTWGAAPELAPDAVRSAPVSTPPEPPTADQVPPVQTAARPAGSRRALVVSLSIAGAAALILGGSIFAFVRSRHPAGVSPVAIDAVTVPVLAPVPATATAAPATAPAPATAAPIACADPEPGLTPSDAPVSSSAAPHVGKKVCKQTGAKCFGNDDCCERTCRKWVCRANASLEDPYGKGK